MVYLPFYLSLILLPFLSDRPFVNFSNNMGHERVYCYYSRKVLAKVKEAFYKEYISWQFTLK
jgi:bacteriorhodopsin